MTPQIDPEFRRLIAPLSEAERAQLEANLRREGCRDPLVVWRGVLLDGHNRFEICTREGIAYKTLTIILADRLAARIWIRWNQLGRRNLTDDMRAMQVDGLLEDLAAQSRRTRASKAVEAREQKAGRRPISEDAASSKIPKISSRLRAKVSKRAKVSERKIKQARTLKQRRPDLAAQVATGELKLAEAIRQTKPGVRAAKLDAAIWPEGQYGVILADPPWRPDDGVLDRRAGSKTNTQR